MDKVTGKVVTKQNINGKVDTKKSVTGTLGMIRGASDYNLLANKPSIEDVTLVGNKTLADFGDVSISNMEIQTIIDSVFNS